MDIRSMAFKNKAPMVCRIPVSVFLFLIVVLLVAGCASVSVKESRRLVGSGPARVPNGIFVKPFTFSEPELRVDRDGPELEALRFELQEKMTRQLVRRLPRYVAPAKAVAANAPLLRGNFWLITGNFDRVHQGSRALRSVVGLGAGRTWVDTTVIVWDLSGETARPFLRIRTTGGSNISPGIGGVATFFISGPMALTSLFNVVDGVRSGLTFDLVRTSREIGASLNEYLWQQGAIPDEDAVGPKRAGEWPNRIDRPEPRLREGTVTVEPIG
ncbi:MAG: DUF4410 domain-containing protein [Terrimicrobiaceae bacterium]|nr:DUF4410 domain-containing protein [Terrimicrobiaceae bacterium]